MGMDSQANIGYGFQLPQSLVESCQDLEDLIKNQNDFDFLFFGDCDDELTVYLVIKKSIQNVYNFDNRAKKINLDKIKAGPNWDIKLKDWAKMNKIKSPKINWWLCCSYG